MLLFLGLNAIPQALDGFGSLALRIGKHMGVTPDQLLRDGLDHVAEIEGALFLRHAGVEHDLQQQVAQFLAQIRKIVARDGVGDLVGFFERVGRDGLEVLLEIPRTAGAGRAQRRHDLDQPGHVF